MKEKILKSKSQKEESQNEVQPGTSSTLSLTSEDVVKDVKQLKEPPTEEPKKRRRRKKKEFEPKTQNFIADTVDNALLFGLNGTVLQKYKTSITYEEIKNTQFGVSVAKLCEHYNIQLEHPLIAVVVSGGLLGMVVMKKIKDSEVYAEIKNNKEMEQKNISQHRQSDDKKYNTNDSKQRKLTESGSGSPYANITAP